MVLPWVSDRESRPLTPGLLGCPFYDREEEKIIFASDNRCSFNIKQSLFRRIGDPKMALPQYTSLLDSKNQASGFDSYIPSIFMPKQYNTSSLQSKPSDLLAFQSGSIEGEYLLAYPNYSSTGLVVKSLKEIDLTPGTPELSISSHEVLDVPFLPSKIKVRRDDLIGAFCAEEILLFLNQTGYSDNSINFKCPENSSLSSFDISWFDVEVAALVQESKNLFIVGDSYRYEFSLSNRYKECSYCLHPSLIALYGDLDEIEFKDIRGANSSFNIKDFSVPFSEVSSFLSHKQDENLISVLSLTDSVPRSKELRIYDLRYPKESTIRVGLDESIADVFYFDSFIDDTTDNILGVDDDMNVNRWEFRHSKSNRQYLDGILCLADFEDSKKFKCDENIIEKRKAFGCNAISSAKKPDTVYFVKVDSDGMLDYCTYSDAVPKSKVGFDGDFVVSAYNKVNFEQLALMEDCSVETVYSSSYRKDDADFTPPHQSTFYLNFYWDEIRSKLTQQ